MDLRIGVNAPETSLNLWDSRKTEDPFDQFKLKFKNIFKHSHFSDFDSNTSSV